MFNLQPDDLRQKINQVYSRQKKVKDLGLS
jgi:hypothetical protein